ncbi:HNH endonuclease [Thermococcus sp. LS2]|uniref:HNH endonuclease n=1 Tax=Thermococcus sp. LS2 TaxID=1638260 RepID=UPI0014388DC7|nr:HNH endonuclease signature motif containing protein [Thermococcus sp. LS2]NJE13179.1 HNH endonuclease [Thermococcus sp. LS2]
MIFWSDESDKSTGDRNITGAMRRDIIEVVKRKCEYCGKRIDTTTGYIHHITPVREGGKTIPSNIIVLCGTCHRKADNAIISRTELRKKVRSRPKEVQDAIRRILNRNKSRKSSSTKSKDPFSLEIPELNLFGESKKKRGRKNKSSFDLELPSLNIEDELFGTSKKKGRKKKKKSSSESWWF